MIDLLRSNHIMILSQSLGFRCRVVSASSSRSGKPN